MSTMHEIADEARALFTNTDTRKSEDTGRTIWTVADHSTCPPWVRDLCHAAHTDADGGDMTPDDWRYEMIVEALDIIADAADEDEAMERADEAEAPVYNAERLRWLASHLWRPSYCDEAAAEYGIEADTSTLDRIALGYLYEWRNVFGSVLGSCRAEAEAREEAETEAADA